MQNNFSSPFIWLIILFIIGSFHSDAQQPNQKYPLNDTLEIKNHTAIYYYIDSKRELTITMDSVSDSRCNIAGIKCITEGNAQVRLTLEQNHQKHDVTLNTFKGGGYLNSTLIDGVYIKLLDLLPVSRTTAQTPQQDYSAKLLIEKK